MWWKRLLNRVVRTTVLERLQLVSFSMPGWVEEAHTKGMRVWRAPDGDVLSLAMLDESTAPLPRFSDETAIRRWSRSIAENAQAGLIEVRAISGSRESSASLIYKRLAMPAYIFTGVLFLRRQAATEVWTAVSGEKGTTGTREAAVTAELFNSGRFSRRGDYEQVWARDPYDADYRGVDGNVLRFISDDECYDEEFPDHPLSKVRSLLLAIPISSWVGSLSARAGDF
jgi:hypothetical protein